MKTVEKANQYIEKNRNKLNCRYRHTYHLMPEIGWCNDPNGFCYYGGQVHLFYQFHPYAAKWGPMHWGHAVSDDMVKWTHLPVALAPDRLYDKNGCFSGSAMEKDGQLYLLYTGVDWRFWQKQCIARSSEGKVFEKIRNNPVISTDMATDEIQKWNFRDPYVFEHNGGYYCMVGCNSGKKGNIALFSSDDLLQWTYIGLLFDDKNMQGSDCFAFEGVCECPSFIENDDCQALIFSATNLPNEGIQYQNVNSVLCMIGELDYKTGKFHYHRIQEIDGGFDFYAAQTTTLPDGRTVMSAWMQLWGRSLPTQKDEWAGAMILPRELTVVEGHLYQTPIREIEKYRTNRVFVQGVRLDGKSIGLDGIHGDTAEILAVFDIGNANLVGVKVFKGGVHETQIYYNVKEKQVVFDRSKSGIEVTGKERNCMTRSVSAESVDGKIKLRIFLDNTSCEVFVNDGYAALTGNVYADETDTGIEFFADGSAALITAEKYDITIL